MDLNDYRSPDHALAYLVKADNILHRTEGKAVLLSFIPSTSKRILDFGTGDGRLIALLSLPCKDAHFVGIDNSIPMIASANQRFGNESHVKIISHDFAQTLPDLGAFDAIVSSFAIHHCTNCRQRSLYTEVLDRLKPNGVFCNLDHVASPTMSLHQRFLNSMALNPEDEDKGNILLDVEIQLNWLREIGFRDVDSHWKWLELCFLGGFRQPACPR